MSFLRAQTRIKYGTIHIDFDAARDFSNTPDHRRVTREMTSRQREHLNYPTVEKVEALLDFVDAQKIINELRQFYESVKDGTSFEFWRNRNLGGYWTFENTLRNNDRLAGTFTRAQSAGQSNAYFFNPDTQLYENVAAVDTPGYPGGKFGRGVAIGGQRKNEVDTDLAKLDYKRRRYRYHQNGKHN